MSRETDFTRRGSGPERRKLSREEIAEAIKCPHWQKIRLSLKGTTTEYKLGVLVTYRACHAFGEYACSTCDQNTMDIQVLNYLHALARGGQLAPLPWNFSFKPVASRVGFGGQIGHHDWSFRLEINK